MLSSWMSKQIILNFRKSLVIIIFTGNFVQNSDIRYKEALWNKGKM